MNVKQFYGEKIVNEIKKSNSIRCTSHARGESDFD